MRLRRFAVTGYKNLRQPIVLDGLGPINLIHGANNVGKSNLLQAIDLLFRCVPLVNVKPGTGLGLSNLGFIDYAPDARSLFNLDRPAPISVEGLLEVPADELAAAGLQATRGEEIDVAATLEWDAASPKGSVAITRFRFADGKDLAQGWTSAEDNVRAIFFSNLLAKNLLVREGPAERFAIVGVDRNLEEVTIQRQAERVPLAVEMYDCRDSPDRLRRDRWRAFVRAMEQFRDVTGEGEFEVTFQRNTSRARLVFDTDKMRVPLSLLGSGVQQVAALLGNLLVRNASIVAIEEPELNLRWNLQDHLRQALQGLVAAPHGRGGLDQIFVTSHSPAFESGESFWLMEATPEGPVVSERPVSELSMVLGSAPRHLGLPERAAQAYVTSQGVLKLPEEVANRLGVQHGGGVVFVDAQPHGVRVVSNDDLLSELELGHDDDGRDAR